MTPCLSQTNKSLTWWPQACVRFFSFPAAAAKSLQSCPTLCDPTDGSPPGSSVPGILQARILEWVAISSPMRACMLSRFSRVRLCATPQTAAHQAPLSSGSSRQEYRSGVPFPSPLAFPNKVVTLHGFYSFPGLFKCPEATVYKGHHRVLQFHSLTAPWRSLNL